MKKEHVIVYSPPVSVKRNKPSALPDIVSAVKAFAYTKHTTRARVSRALGITSSTLSAALKSRNPRIELLLALSEALEFNLLALYLPLLPERLRATNETRKLEEQLDQMQEEKDALQQKLEATERERELLLSLLQGQRN